MLFKISVNNIKKSLLDYAIYFFTLILGISIFYVFNAIGTQTVYLKVSANMEEIVKMLINMLSVVSGFVSVVLGLLIVYASRFLMKRRDKEFALYLMLGMSKGRISLILLLETFLIGVISLFVGLLAGGALSQVMSVLVAGLFEADMSAYKFTISSEAIIKTIIYFGIMYAVVMLFNGWSIGRCKLIDLLQADKKSEVLKLKSPFFCTVIFIGASIALGYAYYRVSYKPETLSEGDILIMIAVGAVSTFLIFWSVSGLLLRIVMSMENVYFRGLNCFTFRQISSKVNTMVMSMTVICLMLFVVICMLSAAFSIRNSLNANLREFCPADCEITLAKYADDDMAEPVSADIVETYGQYASDITDDFEEYVHFHTYGTKDFRLVDFFGEDKFAAIKARHPYVSPDLTEEIIRLSDYNKLMRLYGKKPLELQEGEYILVGNYSSVMELRNDVLADGGEITLFGHTLKPKYRECREGFIDLAAQRLEDGLYVVPDTVVSEEGFLEDYFIGNYKAKTRKEKESVEEKIQKSYSRVLKEDKKKEDYAFFCACVTKIDISDSMIGLGALISLLSMYIGFVFLISCGAILALKELSESVDSVRRYAVIRKIGAEESSIAKSLFCQTGVFFLLPLLLACIHSVFGMKFSKMVLESFGTENILESIASTSIILLLVYGGYFLITYFCSKSIISEK